MRTRVRLGIAFNASAFELAVNTNQCLGKRLGNVIKQVAGAPTLRRMRELKSAFDCQLRIDFDPCWV
jgi:hypothetical protein